MAILRIGNWNDIMDKYCNFDAIVSQCRQHAAPAYTGIPYAVNVKKHCASLNICDIQFPVGVKLVFTPDSLFKIGRKFLVINEIKNFPLV